MKTDTNWEKKFDEKFPQNLFRKSLNWGMEDDPKKDIKVFIDKLCKEIYIQGKVDGIKEFYGENFVLKP